MKNSITKKVLGMVACWCLIENTGLRRAMRTVVMTHTDILVRAFILKIATKAIEGKAWLRVWFEKWVIRTHTDHLVIGKGKGEVREKKAFIMFPRSTIRTWRQRPGCEFTHSIYVSGTQSLAVNFRVFFSVVKILRARAKYGKRAYEQKDLTQAFLSSSVR